jgi:hypothetical protein
MTFQPGQSGNPGGRKKVKPFLDALRMEAIAAENGEPCEAKPGSLRWNARQLLEKGDIATIKEIADRFDGKVAQAIIGGDEDDPAINMVQRIERIVVRPNAPNPNG